MLSVTQGGSGNDHADDSQEDALPSQHDEPGAADSQGAPSGGSDGDEPRRNTPARTAEASIAERPSGDGLAAGGQGAGGFDEHDQPIAGLSFQHAELEYHRGPLPTPRDLAEYEAAVPGAGDRIIRMAETALQAQVDVDVVPIKAEARALVLATFGVAFLPWLLLIIAAGLMLIGESVAALLAGGAGVLTAGPQIINATRRARGNGSRADD